MIYVLTHYTENWKDLANIQVKASRYYCTKHKYGLRVEAISDYPTYTGISKLKMYDLLNCGDIGFFLDCDAIITNSSVRIESFIDEKHDFFISKGLNAGVFILRKSNWSDRFIQYLRKEIEENKCNCEQDAIEKYVREFPDDENILVLNHPSFNSYLAELYSGEPVSEENGQWVMGKSFVLHLPALSLDTREKILKNIVIV